MLECKVALQAQPIVPACLLAPFDQAGGPVEPVSGQQNSSVFGKPRANSFQKVVLNGPPNRTFGLTDAPRNRQGSIPHAYGQHQNLLAFIELALIKSQQKRRASLTLMAENLPRIGLHDLVTINVRVTQRREIY